MMQNSIKVSLAAAVACGVLAANAEDSTWVKTVTSGDWNTGSNWSAGVPGSGDLASFGDVQATVTAENGSEIVVGDLNVGASTSAAAGKYTSLTLDLGKDTTFTLDNPLADNNSKYWNYYSTKGLAVTFKSGNFNMGLLDANRRVKNANCAGNSVRISSRETKPVEVTITGADTYVHHFRPLFVGSYAQFTVQDGATLAESDVMTWYNNNAKTVNNLTFTITGEGTTATNLFVDTNTSSTQPAWRRDSWKVLVEKGAEFADSDYYFRGTNSLFQTSDPGTKAWGANGTMVLANCALVVTNGAEYAYLTNVISGADSLVRVSGEGTTAKVDAFALKSVGGCLEINDGAKMTVSEGFRLSESGTSLQMSGAGTALTVNGSGNVDGDASAATLTGEGSGILLTDSAALTITKSITLALRGASQSLVDDAALVSTGGVTLGWTGELPASMTITNGANVCLQGGITVGTGGTTSNCALRISGKDTYVRCRGVTVGYYDNWRSSAFGTNSGNELRVSDGARLDVFPATNATDPESMNGASQLSDGFVLGRSRGLYGNHLTAESGAIVSNAHCTILGGGTSSDTWGAGRCGYVKVDGATYVGMRRCLINGCTVTNVTRETMLPGDGSYSNALVAVNGGIIKFPTGEGSIRFNTTSNKSGDAIQGGGQIVAQNSRIEFHGAIIEDRADNYYGSDRVTIGGTNGVVRCSSLTTPAETTTPLILRFKVAEGGRAPDADAFLQLTTTTKNATGISNPGSAKIDLDIDDKWATSGRKNYVDLISLPSSAVTTALETLRDATLADPEQVARLGKCTLSVVDDTVAGKKVLRLNAGPAIGLMLILR